MLYCIITFQEDVNQQDKVKPLTPRSPVLLLKSIRDAAHKPHVYGLLTGKCSFTVTLRNHNIICCEFTAETICYSQLRLDVIMIQSYKRGDLRVQCLYARSTHYSCTNILENITIHTNLPHDIVIYRLHTGHNRLKHHLFSKM